MLRGTFDFDVFAYMKCGGRRRAPAYLTAPGGVLALVEHPARGHPNAGY